MPVLRRPQPLADDRKKRKKNCARQVSINGMGASRSAYQRCLPSCGVALAVALEATFSQEKSQISEFLHGFDSNRSLLRRAPIQVVQTGCDVSGIEH